MTKSFLKEPEKNELNQSERYKNINDSEIFFFNEKYELDIDLDEFENFSSRFVLVDSNDEIESETNPESSLEDYNDDKDDQDELILDSSILRLSSELLEQAS